MLEYFLKGLSWAHIVGGSVGLIAFWIPVFAKKGAVNHKRFGKLFINAGWVVVFSAMVGSGIKMGILLSRDIPFSEINNAIGFLMFLQYLALVVGTQLYYGLLVFSEKKDPTKLSNSFRVALASILVAASIGVIVYALILKPSVWIVLLSLSPIGILVGRGMLAYMGGKNHSKRGWWYEHMNTLLTCGIAFHTAFFVFGASRLFELSLSGPWAVIPWVLPALIGVPGSIIWQRYYRKKFNDPISTAKSRAAA